MDAGKVISFTLDEDLELRQFRPGDADIVYRTVRSNYDHLRVYMHWMVPDYSLHSAQDFIDRSIVSAARKESLGFGIFRKGDLIGSIGFVKFSWHARRTELGYWIAQDEEGKGTISKACKLLIDYAFAELDLNRIEIRCSVENTRSAAIPERLGFTLEGVLRQSHMRNGRLHDFSIYGLLRSEWCADKEF